MIQTRLGRRKSLALCTLATALSTFAFIKVKADWAVIVSSMIISAAATAMYAVLCEWRLCVPPLSVFSPPAHSRYLGEAILSVAK